MMFLEGRAPFSLAPGEKERYLSQQLAELLAHHRAGCPPYARLVDDWETRAPGAAGTEQYPFVPVSVFKEYDLRSTAEPGLSVRSSATTGAKSSRIFVDKPTRRRQSLSANRILSDFIGDTTRPYLVFDLERTVRGVEALSARGAAILSLSHLASEFHFVLREEEPDGQLVIDREAFQQALAAIGDRPFIAYGFTYILYQSHQQLLASGAGFRAHADSVFLHSGGWKRMTSLAVDKAAFNRTIAGAWGLPASRVIDFYGSVEQVGMPYPDCPEGLKHVPYWGEVIVRRADTLEPAAPGETGLIQLLNCLPLSAPNHSVLTEDIGEIVVRDGCACGRRGNGFVFHGRAPRAELRGCSDVAAR